jgi:hypothetical protein
LKFCLLQVVVEVHTTVAVAVAPEAFFIIQEKL